MIKKKLSAFVGGFFYYYCCINTIFLKNIIYAVHYVQIPFCPEG